MDERMFTDRTEAGRAETVRLLFDELVDQRIRQYEIEVQGEEARR